MEIQMCTGDFVISIKLPMFQSSSTPGAVIKDLNNYRLYSLVPVSAVSCYVKQRKQERKKSNIVFGPTWEKHNW